MAGNSETLSSQISSKPKHTKSTLYCHSEDFWVSYLSHCPKQRWPLCVRFLLPHSNEAKTHQRSHPVMVMSSRRWLRCLGFGFASSTSSLTALIARHTHRVVVGWGPVVTAVTWRGRGLIAETGSTVLIFSLAIPQPCGSVLEHIQNPPLRSVMAQDLKVLLQTLIKP